MATTVDPDLAAYLRALYDDGMRAPAIAEHTGIARGDVIRALRATGALAPPPAPTAASTSQIADRYLRTTPNATPRKRKPRGAATGGPVSSKTASSKKDGAVGMTAPSGGRPATYPQLHDPDWLTTQAAARRTPTDIARELGCSTSLVSKAYRAANLTAHSRRTRDPRLSDPEWLVGQANTGHTATDIAREVGCTPGTVTRAAARANVTLPNGNRRSRHPELNDPTWLATHARNGTTANDIATQLGCTPGTVTRAARRHNIDLPRTHRSRHPNLNDPDWLTDQHHTRHRTTVEIATDLDVSPTTVVRALRNQQLEVRPDVQVRIARGELDPNTTRLSDPDWLTDQYITRLKSSPQIAAELGVSPNTVTRWLHIHDIAIRPRKTQYPALCYRQHLDPYMADGGTREQIADRIAADLGCSRAAAENALRRHYGRPGPAPVPDDLTDRDRLAARYATASAEQIARDLGVGATTVRRWLDRHGIPPRRVGTRSPSHTPTSTIAELNDRSWLADRYTGRSAADIATELGCSEPTVLAALRRHNIAVRAPSTRAA